MTKHSICSKSEVHEFLSSVKAKLMLNEIDNLIIEPRKDNKNRDFMVEFGLRHRDVANIIKSLELNDYSHSVTDDKYKGNIMKVFGYNLDGTGVYIKISLRKKVICVSIHTQEFELDYPYRDT